MLTFNVILGSLGPPVPRFLVIFFLVVFFVFFFSIRPTDPISGNVFDAKRKKGGWPNELTFLVKKVQ